MNKFKEWLKKHKLASAGIGTAIFLVVGVICFLIGAFLSGWDVFGWLTSGDALFVYALIVILALICGTLIWVDHCKSDNGENE